MNKLKIISEPLQISTSIMYNEKELIKLIDQIIENPFSVFPISGYVSHYGKGLEAFFYDAFLHCKDDEAIKKLWSWCLQYPFFDPFSELSFKIDNTITKKVSLIRVCCLNLGFSPDGKGLNNYIFNKFWDYLGKELEEKTLNLTAYVGTLNDCVEGFVVDLIKNPTLTDSILKRILSLKFDPLIKINHGIQKGNNTDQCSLLSLLIRFKRTNEHIKSYLDKILPLKEIRLRNYQSIYGKGYEYYLVDLIELKGRSFLNHFDFPKLNPLKEMNHRYFWNPMPFVFYMYYVLGKDLDYYFDFVGRLIKAHPDKGISILNTIITGVAEEPDHYKLNSGINPHLTSLVPIAQKGSGKERLTHEAASTLGTLYEASELEVTYADILPEERPEDYFKPALELWEEDICSTLAKYLRENVPDVHKALRPFLYKTDFENAIGKVGEIFEEIIQSLDPKDKKILNIFRKDIFREYVHAETVVGPLCLGVLTSKQGLPPVEEIQRVATVVLLKINAYMKDRFGASLVGFDGKVSEEDAIKALVSVKGNIVELDASLGILVHGVLTHVFDALMMMVALEEAYQQESSAASLPLKKQVSNLYKKLFNTKIHEHLLFNIGIDRSMRGNNIMHMNAFMNAVSQQMDGAAGNFSRMIHVLATMLRVDKKLEKDTCFIPSLYKLYFRNELEEDIKARRVHPSLGVPIFPDLSAMLSSTSSVPLDKSKQPSN